MADVVENLKDSVFKARADANIFAIIVGMILIAIGAFLVFTGQPLIGTIIGIIGVVVLLF